MHLAGRKGFPNHTGLGECFGAQHIRFAIFSCGIVDGAPAADILHIDPRLPLRLFRPMKNDSSALIEFYSFLTWPVL